MYKYSPVKNKKVWIPVFCVLCAVMFFACETKEPAVTDTEDFVPSASTPGVPKNIIEPVKPMIDMIFVKGGTFKMGSVSRSRREYTNQDAEWPRHDVTLNDFSIGKYEVTQGEYYEVTGMRPSFHEKNLDDGSPDGWMTLPVENVNWYDAVVFCNMLSIKEKLKPVYSLNGSFDPDEWGEPPTRKTVEWEAMRMDAGAEGYRLPTESEWEYAARGGAESKKLYKFAGSDNPDHVAWYSGRLNGPPFSTTSRNVGKKQPNELGLYDMSGNVMEWCWDWYGGYTAAAKHNPLGASSGLYRVLRGGSWSTNDDNSRILYRHNNQPHYIGINVGFRVARNN